MPNWIDGERRDTVKVQCVNPTNYGHVGWLSVSGATLTESYYSDTRIQGTVTALDASQYVPLSMLRIIHEATFSNGETYRRTLGTFFAIRSSDTWKSGAQVTDFELKSVLYGMSDDICPFDYTIGKGALAQGVYNAICGDCARPRLWVSGANNKRFEKNVVLEAGDSHLSWLHQLADMSGNRVDCDELGRVTMAKYTPPSHVSPKMKLPFNSPLVLASGISRRSNEMEVPSRSIVTWEHEYETKVVDGKYKSDYTDQGGVFHRKGDPREVTKTERKTVTEFADVVAGNPASLGRRGFRVASWHSMDDMGDSKATAQQYARSFLAEESQPTTTWDISTRWWEVGAGDVINWKPSESEPYRKALVQNIDKDLLNFTMRITLKEV